VKSHLSRLLAFIFLAFNFSVSANLKEHHLLYKILENSPFCVQAIEGDKIFLNVENIVSTNAGFFLSVNEMDFIRLPFLQWNFYGYFVESGFISVAAGEDRSKNSKGPCPACDKFTDKRGVCHNSGCDFYGLKVL